MKQDFETIYQKNKWGNGSGSGSVPKYCDKYLQFLSKFLTDNSIKSVVDIGCGDFQLYENFDWSKVSYAGCDISSTALSMARERTNLPLHEVSSLDETLNFVKNQNPELVILKDVMMHWTDDELKYFLTRLTEFPWKWVVTANNYKYSRDPSKNGRPRELDRYRWAPIPNNHPTFVEFGFTPVMKYWAKQVMISCK